jgi:chromosome segregation ATPase
MKNSTDLHIQYHMETGESHQWLERGTGAFHTMDWYSREYALWLEERLLAKRKHTDTIEELQELLEYAEQEVQNANREIANLEEREAILEDEIEALHESNAGADL